MLTVAGTLALLAASPAVAGAITVSPLPGTPDASPTAQISILGTPLSNIASVSVTGSLSGAHEGQLQGYSSAPGASYVLDTPLTEGEEVSVVVDLNSGGPIDDSFTVAHLGPISPRAENPGEKPEEQEHYVSAPELNPPKITVTKTTPGLEGDIFLDPLPAPQIHVGKKLIEFEPVSLNGSMILNPQGKMLWWHPLPKGNVASLTQVVSYEGKPAIAWWQGYATEAAFGQGEEIIANTSYEPIATVKAGNGYKADIHELSVTPAGQVYLDAYSTICLPNCAESNGETTLDSVVQEIDIHTGLVMWEWHALGHVPITDTEVEPQSGVFDPYHMNSVQPLPEGHVLISLRDTSGIYMLNQSTGAIEWTIGGKKGEFKLTRKTDFHFQHDPRLEGNRLTVFDNEGGPPVDGVSRGLVLKLNIPARKVQAQGEYERPEPTFTEAEGSTQRLKHGDVMVGWGATQYFSEFSKSGELLFNAEVAKGDGTYRVLRFPWSATPKTLPAVAATRESLDEVSVYASWNGATAVASWEVLAGESPGTLAPVATSAWTGFETKIGVPSAASTFEVRALNSRGAVLATSSPVTAP